MYDSVANLADLESSCLQLSWHRTFAVYTDVRSSVFIRVICGDLFFCQISESIIEIKRMTLHEITINEIHIRSTTLEFGNQTNLHLLPQLFLLIRRMENGGVEN